MSLPNPHHKDADVLTIADIGELALIERLEPFCEKGAIGDDAALMRLKARHKLVVTTDMLVENVHFSGNTTPPYSVGWRAAASNLADLVAMGASPIGITIGLGLPAHTHWDWVEALYQGFKDCLKVHNSSIFGGDLCRSAQLNLSITALGQVRPTEVITRSSAVPGMTVVVTGAHGASRAGLALLLEELDFANAGAATDSPVRFAQGWIKAHQLPVPRFDAITCLRQLIEQGDPETVVDVDKIAGMDSSDGLASTLLQLSSSSQVGMDIVRSHIPLPPGLSAAVGPKTALEWALHGGEDFELVLCLPTKLAEAFTQTPFATAIGITTSTGIVKLLPTEGSETNTPLTYEGFQHFSKLST